MKKICLTFICRDNEEVIQRMIGSCLPIIDFVVAVDTGSKDNTKKKIHEFMKGKDIPYLIFQNTWINFGYNRTLMMNHAREAMKGWEYPDFYFLVMDSDEVLNISDEYSAEKLTGDVITIPTTDDASTWQRDRIFSSKFDWHWIGAAHEYPEAAGKWQKQIGAPGLTLTIYPKQNNNHIERNLKLLLEYNKEFPKDTRTMFYLGQSQYDLGHFPEAKYWYEKRAMEYKFFPEEVWYSIYKIAHCYRRMNQFDKAEEYFVKAFAKRPSRAEAPFHLAMMKHSEKKYDEAIEWFTTALNIKYPENDGLFIEGTIYDYDCLFNYSVSLYWAGRYQEGFDTGQRIKSCQNVPEHIYEQNLKNIAANELQLIRNGWKERFVVSPADLRYDGLGDHLFYSNIPLLAKKAGFKKVYLSAKAMFKTPGTKQFVYIANRDVDGEVEDYCPFIMDDLAVNTINGLYAKNGLGLIDAINYSYGLFSYDKSQNIPVIGFSVEPPKEKINVLFDGHNKTLALTHEQLDRFFKELDFQPKKQVVFSKTETDLKHGNTTTKRYHIPIAEKIEIKTPTMLYKLLTGTHVFICLTTGTAILASMVTECTCFVLTTGQWMKDFPHHMMRTNIYVDVEDPDSYGYKEFKEFVEKAKEMNYD